MIKAYVLPRESNKELIRALHRVYIREEFPRFTQRLSVILRSPKILNVTFSRDLLLLINKIYLNNIYKYTDPNSISWFLQSLKNRQFGWELNIESYYIYDFFRPLMGMGVNDIDSLEIENTLAMELNSFLTEIYNSDSDSFNEIFIEVFETFQRYIPTKFIRVCKFDLTPNLAPLVFYTEWTVNERIQNESLCNQ